MDLIVFLKNEKQYTFKGVREYSIEYGKYLTFTYVNPGEAWTYRMKGTANEGRFMLDAIVGYYVHKLGNE